MAVLEIDWPLPGYRSPPVAFPSPGGPAGFQTAARCVLWPADFARQSMRFPIRSTHVRIACVPDRHAVARPTAPGGWFERYCCDQCSAPQDGHSVAPSLPEFVGFLACCRARRSGPRCGWWHHRSRRSTGRPGRDPPASETENYPASLTPRNMPFVPATRARLLRVGGAGAIAAAGSSISAAFRDSLANHPGPDVRQPASARSRHSEGAREPESSAPNPPPVCDSTAGRVIGERFHHPRVRQYGSTVAARGGRVLSAAAPLRLASNVFA